MLKYVNETVDQFKDLGSMVEKELKELFML